MPDQQPVHPIQNELATFLKANSYSSLVVDSENTHISKPWSDDTLRIVVQSDNKALIECLNGLVLPRNFSALWHRNTGDLEFIFTGHPASEEYATRAFEFTFNGATIKCGFGPASQMLVVLADAILPTGPPSSTGFRNMMHLKYSFDMFRHSQKDKKRSAEEVAEQATSFWIRGVRCDENEVLQIAKHLNFYMSYFDRGTPRILFHEDATPASTNDVRYPHGPFPPRIQGQVVDQYLLTLWENAESGDILRRFLHSYQILEYAAFYHLQEGLSLSLRKLLTAPDALSRPEEIVRQTLDLLVDDRMGDDAKLISVVKQCVDPTILWPAIKANEAVFSSELSFDGGFCVPQFIKAGWTLDDFKAAWIPKFPDCLRKVRNAIVHARESRIAKGIAPTAANHRKLLPWTMLTSLAAMHVIVYRY